MSALFQANQRTLKKAADDAAASEQLLAQANIHGARTKAELEKLADDRLLELEGTKDRHALALRERDARIRALHTLVAQLQAAVARTRTDLKHQRRAVDSTAGTCRTRLPPFHSLHPLTDHCVCACVCAVSCRVVQRTKRLCTTTCTAS